MNTYQPAPPATPFIRRKPYFYVSLALVAAGLAVSLYLLRHYLALQHDPATPDVCSAVFKKSCDNALQSGYSLQAGLPLAGWALLFYLSLLLFLLLPSLFGHWFRQFSRTGIFLFTAGALVAALILLAVMLLHPSLFCPFCTLLHAINILLFFFLDRTLGLRAFAGLWPFRKSGEASGKDSVSEKAWRWAGMASFLFLLFSLYYGLKVWTRPSGNNGEPALIRAQPILDSFYRQPVRSIPTGPLDPVAGPDSSPVRIVVFSDFLCPACRRFSSELDELLYAKEYSFRIVFKNFPLSSACNPYSSDQHHMACNAALAGMAAHKQGKFWPYHDTLFQLDAKDADDPFLLAARKAGLDMELFGSYLSDEEAKRKISGDIELAHRLQVDGTPAVFINGRRVTDMRPGIPSFLARQEWKRVTAPSDTTKKAPAAK